MNKLVLLAVLAVFAMTQSVQAHKYDDDDHKHYKPKVMFADRDDPYTFSIRKGGASLPQKITVFSNGVTFNSDYDNGSLAAVSYNGNVSGRESYDCDIYVESGEIGPRSYWFRFTMDGVSNGSYNLNIDHSDSPFPAIRFFSSSTSTWSDWRATTSSEAPSLFTINFDTTIDQDLVEIAFFYPLGYQETYDRVEALVDSSIHATSTVLTDKSFLGNDFVSVTVNDTSIPDDEKHGVWVHSRAHAGEVTSTWTLLGFLDQFVADDAIGERLRRYCRLDMLVLQNVDGVILGNTRWDSQGVDPERWDEPTVSNDPGCLQRFPAIPSQTVLKDLVDARLASVAPPEVALNLHSTVGNWDDSFFFQRNFGGSANVQQSFRTILQDYVDAFVNATPLFANADPAFSTLRICSDGSGARFIESYFYTERGEGTMAMTHEGYYWNRGHGDFGYWTDEEYIELGRAQARALIEYFDLPEVPEASVSDWFIIH